MTGAVVYAGGIMNCGECGAELPAGAGRCPQCLALVKQPGWWRRLLERFGVSFHGGEVTINLPGVETHRTEVRSEQITIQDERTGQTRVYHSLEEVPAGYRQKLEALRKQGAGEVMTQQHFTVRESDGTTRTYRSIEEMPPHLRAVFEKMRARRS